MMTKNAARIVDAFQNLAKVEIPSNKDKAIPVAEQETSDAVKKRVARIMQQYPGMTYEAAYSLYINTKKDAEK